jgi:hypothetical protein
VIGLDDVPFTSGTTRGTPGLCATLKSCRSRCTPFEQRGVHTFWKHLRRQRRARYPGAASRASPLKLRKHLDLSIESGFSNRTCGSHWETFRYRQRGFVASCIQHLPPTSPVAPTTAIFIGYWFALILAQSSFKVTVLLKTRLPGVVSGSTLKYPMRSNWKCCKGFSIQKGGLQVTFDDVERGGVEVHGEVIPFCAILRVRVQKEAVIEPYLCGNSIIADTQWRVAFTFRPSGESPPLWWLGRRCSVSLKSRHWHHVSPY